METCKARICIENRKMSHIEGYKWTKFRKCNRKNYRDGFCKKCISYDNRPWALNSEKYWGERWKRDGIYGKTYNFPYHVTDDDKLWVNRIYELYPEIKPIEIINKELFLLSF